MISVILFHVIVAMTFFFFLRQTLRQLGPRYAFIFSGYIILNIFFLLQMPFYSDDIYNYAVSEWFLGDLWKNLFSAYHYARFPITTTLVMGTLRYYFHTPGLAHLLLFTTHGTAILLLGSLLKKYLNITNYLYLCLLLILFSLNSNVENLLWFAAIHENISLWFATLSVFFFIRIWENPGLPKRGLYFLIACFLQVLSVASSEVGYLLLFLHPIFLAVIQLPKMSWFYVGRFLKHSILAFPIMIALLLLYRGLIAFLLNVPLTASPYQVSAISQALFYFSRQIMLFPIQPISDFFLEKTPLLAFYFVITAVITFCFSDTVQHSTASKSSPFWPSVWLIIGFFSLSILQILPHALVATTLQYNFPRFSYLFAIFSSLGIAVSLNLIAHYLAVWKKALCRTSVLFLLTLVSCIYLTNWTQNILLKIINTKHYIASFESGLESQLSNQVMDNSLVLFSFTDQPPVSLISYIRPYDLLQWNHGVIGYFKSGFIRNLPTNVHAMPLDHQNIHNLNNINLTLTGSYWVQYGNNPQAVLTMIDTLKIEHLSHYYYTGQQLQPQIIKQITLYDVDFTLSLTRLIK